MKLIDLLNKIANGEETKSIEYKMGTSLTYYLYDKFGRECDDTNLVNILNDEVEIIEDKKIERLKTYKEIDDEEHYANILKVSKNGEYEINEALSVVVDKINEIIDKINEE